MPQNLIMCENYIQQVSIQIVSLNVTQEMCLFDRDTLRRVVGDFNFHPGNRIQEHGRHLLNMLFPT